MTSRIKKMILGIAILLTVSSCETLQEICDINEDDVSSGELFVNSLTQVLDVYERIDIVRRDSTLIATGNHIIDGANCTLTNDSMIIDFGNSPVVTQDGKYHSGSIRSKVTGDYSGTSGSIESQLVDYQVNDNSITGSLAVTNESSTQQPQFVLTTTNFEVNADTKVNYNLNLNWLNGFESITVEDDVMELSGQLTGLDSISGKEFTAEILSPVHLNRACSYLMESGEVRLSMIDDELVPTIDIDFISSDSCNNLFNASVDCKGNPLSFTFPFEN